MFSGEQRISFDVGEKSRPARDSLKEITAVSILRWQLKLAVKSASPLPAGEVKKERVNPKTSILSNQAAGTEN